MLCKKIKAKYKDEQGNIKEETFESEYSEDAFEVYSSLTDEYNAEENNRKESHPDYPTDIRIPVSAEWLENNIIIYCDFQKISLVSLKDSKGWYDRHKCLRCGKVRRRYTLAPIKKTKCAMQ